MKLAFIFLLFFATHLAVIKSERLSIIGSQFIPDDSNYKVILLTNKLDSSSQVDISLVSDGIEASKQLKNFKGGSFSEVDFVVPKINSTNYELRVKTSTASKCKQQSITLIRSQENPRILIQLDKPIYKTGEEFKFRIFILDQQLLPLTSHCRIDISVFDSKSHLIQRFNSIKASTFGSYENAVKIADAPNLGKWKIQVNAMDRKITKFFDVQQSVENRLEVFLDMPAVVAFQDRRLYMTILVNDKNDKFFNGIAKVSATASFSSSPEHILINQHLKNVDILGNKKSFSIDFADDMGIRFPTADMKLKFFVEVMDKVTKRITTVSKEIEMKYKDRNVIQVIRKKYFKPGFKFPTKVRVKLLDGRLDNSFNQLSLTNEYHNLNKRTNKIVTDKKTFRVNLKNGETFNTLLVKPETVKVIVDMEFAGVKLREEIFPLPPDGVNEYMQISGNKSSNVGDRILISAQSTEEMENLHVLVIGQEGIIYSHEYREAAGIDIYKFTIELTEKMRPEARVLVFYVKPNTGDIIYDELTLNLGFSIDNSLDIFAVESAKPNMSTTIKFKTAKGSKVFLSASDLNPFSINRGNEILRGDIYNELVYYLNLKFPNSSSYHLERLNAFMLNPLQTGESCLNEPVNTLTFNSNEVQPESDGNDVKYFPENWFYESYEAKTDLEMSIARVVPESHTNWRYFGISVHPAKGLTVGKVQPKTSVKSDISIQLKTPPSAYDDEIIWIELSVYNYLMENINALVSISIEKGHFVDKTKRTEFNIECLDFIKTDNSDDSFNLNIEREKLTSPKSYLIHPVGTEDITITVKASSPNFNDEVKKVIKIVKRNVVSADIMTPESEKTSDDFISSPNLLGPALGGLDKLFDNPLQSDEEKILKFQTAIINHSYLKLINDQEAIKTSLQDVVSGYQEALFITDNLNTNTSTWLAALTTEALIEASHLISVDKTLILKLLNFIKDQQDGNHVFKYDASYDHREEMGDTNRKDIQAAQIIAAFLKYDKNNDSFKRMITLTLQHLLNAKNKNDYQKIVTAYAFVLNQEPQKAKDLLNSIDNNPLLNVPTEVAISAEIVAYKIMTKVLLQVNPEEDVKWLLKQRNGKGGFYSPYVTCLALQAFYAYTNYKNHISSSVNTQIDQFYATTLEPVANTTDYFIITANRVETRLEEIKLDVQIKVNGSNAIKDLIVLEVELPRGYKYIRHDIAENVLRTIVRNDENVVIFYVNKLEKEQTFKQSIHAVKLFEFSKHKQSRIRVYDYYRSNLKDTFYYVHDKNEEACERIEVERQIKKAKENLQKAQRAVNVTLEAKKKVENAENINIRTNDVIEKADQAILSANANIIATKEILENAMSSTETTREAVADDLNQIKDLSEPQVTQLSNIANQGQKNTRNQFNNSPMQKHTTESVPNFNHRAPSGNSLIRMSRDVENPDSEAIKAQKAFESAKLEVEKATTEVENAKNKIDEASRGLTTANKNFGDSTNEMTNALNEINIIQRSVDQKKENIVKYQQTAKQKQDEVNNEKQKIDQFKNDFKRIKTLVSTTNEAVIITQSNVNDALDNATKILDTAIGALKGKDAETEVENTAKLVNEMLYEANKTFNLTTDTLYETGQFSKNFKEKYNSQQIKSDCESFKTNSILLEKQAQDLLTSSQEKIRILQDANNKRQTMRKLSETAKTKFETAEAELKKAQEKLKSKNAAKVNAERNANAEREAEAQRANQMVEEMIKESENITSLVEEISTIKSIINKSINSIKKTRQDASDKRMVVEKNQLYKNETTRLRASRISDSQKLISILNKAQNNAIQYANNSTVIVAEVEKLLNESKESNKKIAAAVDAFKTTQEYLNVDDKFKDIRKLKNIIISNKVEIQKINEKLIEFEFLANKSYEAVTKFYDTNEVRVGIRKNTSLFQQNSRNIDWKLIRLENVYNDTLKNIKSFSNAAQNISLEALTAAEDTRKAKTVDEAVKALNKADKAFLDIRELYSNFNTTYQTISLAVTASKNSINAMKLTAEIKRLVTEIQDIQIKTDDSNQNIYSSIKAAYEMIANNQDTESSNIKSALKHYQSSTANATKLAVEKSIDAKQAADEAINATKKAFESDYIQASNFASLSNHNRQKVEDAKNEVIRFKNTALVAKQASEFVFKSAEALKKAVFAAANAIGSQNALKLTGEYSKTIRAAESSLNEFDNAENAKKNIEQAFDKTFILDFNATLLDAKTAATKAETKANEAEYLSKLIVDYKDASLIVHTVEDEPLITSQNIQSKDEKHVEPTKIDASEDNIFVSTTTNSSIGKKSTKLNEKNETKKDEGDELQSIPKNTQEN